MENIGLSPLHLAALHGHLHVVQYLCEQGADKEARDVNDVTPLDYLARNVHLPV